MVSAPSPLHTNLVGPHRPFFFLLLLLFMPRTHLKDYSIWRQVVPGDNATLTIELIYPVPMADGLRFALREGGKTVGAGVVVKVLEWTAD